MKQKILTLILMLTVCSSAFSQISFSTLQKLATLNGSSDEVREILKPQGFKNIGRGEWIKKSSNGGRESITVGVTFEGNQVSYNSINIPKIKTTVESIKKLGNFVFNENDGEKIHFRNTDKKQFYEVVYSDNYSRCTIAVFPYKEPKKEEVEKDEEETTTMVAIAKDAEFIGGQSALNKYLSNSIDIKEINQYKEESQTDRIDVNVIFIVNKDGSISNIEVNPRGRTRSVSFIKKEIERVFKNMPKWKPAELKDGTPVRTSKQMPLTL